MEPVSLLLLFMGLVGSFSGNVLSNVAAGRFDKDIIQPLFDNYTNHDIQKAFTKAWSEAVKAIFNTYRQPYTPEEQQAVEQAKTILASEATVARIFDSPDGDDPDADADGEKSATLLTLSDIGLLYTADPQAANQELQAKLDKLQLLQGLPTTLQDKLKEELLGYAKFYFIEIAVKREPRARDAYFHQQLIALREAVDAIRTQMQDLTQGAHIRLDNPTVIIAIFNRIANGKHTDSDILFLRSVVWVVGKPHYLDLANQPEIALGTQLYRGNQAEAIRQVMLQVLDELPDELPRTAHEQPALTAPVSMPMPVLAPPPALGPVQVNPFTYGAAVAPERFYGRYPQRADVRHRIGGISAQCISIVGHRRSGKSSFLRFIRERIADEFCFKQQAIVVDIDLQDARFHTPAGVTEGLRRGIAKATGTAPWQRDENDDPFAVQDGLDALHDDDNTYRLIVLIDEFERIGDRLEQFQDWGEDWRAKASAGYFALVVASKRPISDIYKTLGLTSPFGNIFSETTLGPFTQEAWHTLVQHGFAATGRALSDADLALIDELAAGLPFYTQMAASLLWQYGDHAQTKAAFAQQAEPRIRELWDNLYEEERITIRHAAGVAGARPPSTKVFNTLLRQGLLLPNGDPYPGFRLVL